MNKTIVKKQRRNRRHARIRSTVFGTVEKPRLSVFKSNKALYAQLIDDEKGHTIASASSHKVSGKTMKEKAVEIGKEIASKAKDNKIDSVVFDRGGFIFTGNIKLIADSAREAGLKF